MTIQCNNCGHKFDLDVSQAVEVICPACDANVSLEGSAPEAHQAIQLRKKELEEQLKKIEENVCTGEDKEFHALLETYKQYKKFPGFNNLWYHFILHMATIVAKQSDVTLKTHLKHHAQQYDQENGTVGGSLYVSILQSCPGLATRNDWAELIKQASGDANRFVVLCEYVIDFILQKQDKAFAIDIFNTIKRQKGAWAAQGRSYLRALMTNDVADKLFPVNKFDGKTQEFVRSVKSYCDTYLQDDSIIVADNALWKNYTEAQKRRKRRTVIGIIPVCVAVLATAIGLTAYANTVDPETVQFDIDRVIESTYGETLDLSAYTVTYKKHWSNAVVTKPITQKMLSGYNSEKLGAQTVYVNFKGTKTGITIHVNTATLLAPVLTQSGNYITWEFVPHATDYNVYVNSSSVLTTTTTALSYDLSTNVNYGELSVTVRANSNSDKYANSAMSAALTVTKLQAPANLRYEDGDLVWDAVVGAATYELSLNGTPYTLTTNRFQTTDFVQGENAITLIAKSSLPSVVDGVTKQGMPYYRLNPITSMSYQNDCIYWEAEENATWFTVLVDGNRWKDFNRNYFSVQDDGFALEFGESEHTITVICNSHAVGAVPSQANSFKVAVGNHVQFTGNSLQWNSVGAGATYFVRINGESPRNLSTPELALSDILWKVGANTVVITASIGNETIICETLEVTKLPASTVAVESGNWVTDGNANNRYRVDSGEWQNDLPALDTLAAGEYTISVMRVASGGSAIEIDSDVMQIKIKKLAVPVISVSNEEIVANYDRERYVLELYYYETEVSSAIKLQSLSDIHAVGTHFIKAALAPLGEFAGIDYVINSELSSAVEVVKLAAPSVSYIEGADHVTSESGNIKFYYLQNGVEHELVGGLIANLPKGTFEVYARRVAQPLSNELTSDNTPIENRVTIFNMNISLSISKSASSQFQLIAVFSGCEDVDSLTFTYEIKYYNRDGIYIGETPLTAMTLQKSNQVSSSNISTMINYRGNAQYENGYGWDDIYTVELVVHFASTSGEQVLTARMTK